MTEEGGGVGGGGGGGVDHEVALEEREELRGLLTRGDESESLGGEEGGGREGRRRWREEGG